MTNIRRVRDIVSIKRTIASNYDKFRNISVFYGERREVLEKLSALPDEEIAKIAEECREGGVRWRSFVKHLNKLEAQMLTGEVTDYSQAEECGIKEVCGKEVAELIKIRETASGVIVSFDVDGTFDIYSKANRNGCFELIKAHVTPETEFIAVNETNPFWEDRYSIALRSEKISFAISVEDPKTGKKGGACARIYVLENGSLKIDDLSKYFDTTPLTLWIAP